MIPITNNELFAKAILDADSITYKSYLAKKEFSFIFSQGFEKKMQKLISKENRISFPTRRRISKALVAAIIALIVMFTGLMSTSASRQKIIGFTEKVLPHYTDIKLSEDSTTTLDHIETYYTLGYVPEGFELETYEQDVNGSFSLWNDELGNQMVFTQSLIDSVESIDNEHYYNVIEINDYHAYISANQGTMSILWKDDCYSYFITMNFEDEELLIKLAENIVKK